MNKARLCAKVLKAIGLYKIGIKTPVKVTHEISFRCNLRCKYCGIYKLNYKEMTTERIKNAMKEFSEIGTVMWGISGGEPLLHRDIGEIVDYGKSLGFITDIVTNGTFIRQRIKEIENLDMLIVSIDGLKEVHDFIRGKGSYERAIDGAKTAKYAGLDVVLQIVLSRLNTKDNGSHLKEFLDIARDMDCKVIFQSIYQDPYNKNEKIDSLKWRTNDYINALKLIRNFKKENKKLVLLSDAELDWFEKFGDKNLKWRCFAGQLYCRLLPNGFVAPCLYREKDGVDGLKHGFKNAFNALPKYPGCICWNSCFTKYNQIFSLKPGAIFNALRSL